MLSQFFLHGGALSIFRFFYLYNILSICSTESLHHNVSTRQRKKELQKYQVQLRMGILEQ